MSAAFTQLPTVPATRFEVFTIPGVVAPTGHWPHVSKSPNDRLLNSGEMFHIHESRVDPVQVDQVRLIKLSSPSEVKAGDASAEIGCLGVPVEPCGRLVQLCSDEADDLLFR